MKPSLYIALRFTAARKRSLVFSLSGVILGVAFFICTQAQTQGFEKFFIETVLGTSGAVTVGDRFQPRYDPLLKKEDGAAVSGQQSRKYYSGVDNPGLVIRCLESYSSVLAVAPYVEGNVTLRTNFKEDVVKLQGIDLAAQMQATTLKGQIIEGDIDRFKYRPYGLLVGTLLANKLQVHAGEIVYVAGTTGNPRAFTIEGIFQSGINAVDQTRVYAHLATAQSILNKPYQITSIVVRLRDPQRAPQIAAQFEQQFLHVSRSWQDREQGNLAIFHALRLSSAIVVSLIILLAGFGIFNILTMTVLNKVREIAILRSMGYRRGDIQAIFLFQGLIIASIGSAVGCLIGAALTYTISLIPLHMRGIMNTDHFVVAWSSSHYVWAVLIAFASVLVASYFPARRAATLPPVNTLRGSGQ
ncbi:lipoprotein-releasing system permease protein [Verrucomicrobium sp. GAS474]|uniref:ABC transporter permease n=1 Tax=Verrucomicrobium sp. GAS474 TaxID=1882831 RepID=UPI00087D1424|nr:ABC transporter permease [Verrucomicrobium sp. GAS474]SDT88313.1 lipoprotein-releasing system permease protein [Verrucomicrobium sp. GAS474]